MIDAGPIDLSDGVLWDNGGEYLASGAGSTRATRFVAGDPHVVLLLANSGKQPGTVVAVEVRVGSARPKTWRQFAPLQGSTGAREMAIAGRAALERLRAARSEEDAFKDLDATRSWLTPCLRYAIHGDAPSAPSTALMVRLPGSGAWPGAIGYDASNKAADVVMAIGVVPWSLLGLPGRPPSQAAAVEPTASP